MHEDLYERMADFEWTRYDRLTAAISFQAGLVLAVGAAIGFLARYRPLSEWPLSFKILGAVTTLAWIYQVYLLFRAWYGREYAYLPPANELENVRVGLRKHYRSLPAGDGDPASKANADFDTQLTGVFCGIAEHNARQNNDRSAYVHRAGGAFAISVVCLSATFVTHIIQSGEKSPSEITISRPIEVKLMPANDESNTPATQESENSGAAETSNEPAQQEVIPKPPELKPVLIREGQTGSRKTLDDNG